ncbi:F-box protein SKIP24 [Benincasa hispida]|uniref:F-box protein SKIP24 n=1 Tax=Benincasa hispida TaxID=102211 RepID=UPI0018FF746B|nr:F-box protein SKIP24 [Benincasa hispida]XP_038882939.1 F-box protein SKIP24 [Benincasa hispida]
MSELPVELWTQILEVGVKSYVLTYKDLCCVSISSPRLRRLSDDDCLWSHLLSSDYPSSSSSFPSSASSSKSLYKIRLERDRNRKKAAHMRAVLRKESQIAEHYRRLGELENWLMVETNKLTTTLTELSNLRTVREATVALNVWQPEVIRARQTQIVEQCSVSVDSRSRTLDMELKICKQQIAIFWKALKDERQRLNLAKEELTSLKYHPLKDHKFIDSSNNVSHIKRRSKDAINSKVKQLRST